MASESNERILKSSEEVARSTPLDPIAEEKRFENNPSSEDGPPVVQILTIEISEIPIAGEDDMINEKDQDQNNEDQKPEEANEEEKKDE